MNYTVVGIFDDKSEARSAMEELIRDGFVQENIDLSEANYAGDTSTATSGTAATTNQSAGDGISSFFSNLFSDNEAQARSYTNVARDADAILTVQADSQERAREVAAIFDRNGAIDVDERSSQYGQQQQFTGSETHGAVGTQQQNLTGEAVIPVIQEELNVGKREVEHGGVRVRSRVIEKPVEEHLRLREERVVVNRRPVNRAVTDADTANFQQGDFVVTERAEEAVVSKQARVVEEVEVGKRVEEHDQVVRDTVRRTDVDVEEINTGTTRSATTDIDTDDTARGAGR